MHACTLARLSFCHTKYVCMCLRACLYVGSVLYKLKTMFKSRSGENCPMAANSIHSKLSFYKYTHEPLPTPSPHWTLNLYNPIKSIRFQNDSLSIFLPFFPPTWVANVFRVHFFNLYFIYHINYWIPKITWNTSRTCFLNG